MLKDFVLADAVAIQAQGKYIDLHNDFDLVSIFCNMKHRSFEIEFARVLNPGASPRGLILRFLDVDWMEITPGVLSVQDSGYVDEIGYKEPTDRDDIWILSEGQASADAHLFIRLSETEFIRLHARQAQAIVRE